jgi:adenylate cyclase
MFLYGNHDPGVCCSMSAARRLWLTGFPDQALAAAEDSLRLARQGGHPYTIGIANYYGAVLHYWRGEYDSARQLAAEVVTLTEQRGILSYFSVGSKLLVHVVGGVGPGLAELGDEVVRLRTGGVLARRVFHASLLAEAYGSAGSPERGLDVLTDALKAVDAGAERFYESALHRLRGELLLAIDADAEDAEACLRRAVGAAQAIGARSLELRAATSLARWLAECGTPAEARAVLAPVLGAFTEGHATRDLRCASALLAQLE